MGKIIDLRSDTVTKPSKKMLTFMTKAKLGDDVYGEDFTVNKLENKISKMAKKEAALFVPTGTQANLLALLSHCQRGDEYICGNDAHIYKYEAGGGAVVGGIQPQPLEFQKDGSLDLERVKCNIKPQDSHFAKTKLLCLENTHHGQALSIKYHKKAYKFAKKNNLCLHVDGARIFNAACFHGIKLSKITSFTDSISICLSKGLGAPVGSLLVGSREFIQKARRYRKMLGGGMRQAGVIAAAGLYALKHHMQSLENDHENAQNLALHVKDLKHIRLVSCYTNMLFVETRKEDDFVGFLEKKGILISGYGKQRIVFHRDISFKDTQKVIKAFQEFDLKAA